MTRPARIGLAILGFAPPPRKRGKAPPAPSELAAIEVERAFRCGARYCVSRWRRRAPPRFRGIRPSRPGYLHALDQQRAFYRGYDAATRALIAHRAAWVEPWLERRVA